MIIGLSLSTLQSLPCRHSLMVRASIAPRDIQQEKCLIFETEQMRCKYIDVTKSRPYANMNLLQRQTRRSMFTKQEDESE